jgi:hypothetical protein
LDDLTALGKAKKEKAAQDQVDPSQEDIKLTKN